MSGRRLSLRVALPLLLGAALVILLGSSFAGSLWQAGDPQQAGAAAGNTALTAHIPGLLAGTLLILLLGLWLFRYLVRPLVRLEEAARRLAVGVDGPPLPESGPREVARLAHTLNTLEACIDTSLAALRESEARYRQLFDAHPLPQWIQDPRTQRILAVNDAAVAQYGYSRERFLALSPQSLLATADRAGALAGGGEAWLHRRADGSLIAVELSTHPVDWLGTRAELVSAHDVTARRVAEDTLRLAEAAFETSEAIVITDPEGVILRVNQAFTRITGYPPEEVAGQTPRVLKSGYQDAAFYEHFWQQIKGVGHWEGEIWNRHRDGHIYPEWLRVRAVRDERGGITHFISNFFDLSERKAAEEAILRLTRHDPLTDLPNRALFHDRVARALAAARRGGSCGAVLQLNLDRFKAINDARGHALGDELLRLVGGRLAEALHAEDTLARLGADEFAVLLNDLHPPAEAAASQAHHVAEKLRTTLEEPFEIHGTRYHLAASVGVAVFPQGQNDADDLLREADTALNQAKAAGRDAVCFFKSAMGAQARARFTLESELRHAIDAGELALFLQPQVDGERRLVAAEALVRWHHPRRGTMPPGVFIPLAEESGLIVALGDWVLRRACGLLAREDVARAGLRIAVNMSPRQFAQEDFVARVRRILADTGADPTRLLMEVTEGVMLDRLADTIAKMSELAALGIHFSIDDFGTGYSSLAYLKRLPIHELKIDKAFIQDAPGDPNDAALVDAILAVARHLNLRVVAEGVETEEQAAFLRARGHLLYQGYLFGSPLEAEGQIERWLAEGALRPAG
ncbi:EAL domain-containing protein [Pseudothauera nasutitermitis]|uniref:EAL domain-containing protein n=1 Tax=Pseudothauera nasutitermitis TaxID=2565930 RepID=A0A4S4B3V5_9RHOO|nr:EAL domain-containing protein [Pseudothauera nasutitermitis]THF66410.1 EAL domain-containing protein [Pseudothauera nasutitermitis]